MTTSVQPVLPVSALASTAWPHLSGWHDTTSGSGWRDCDGPDEVCLTEAVILQELRDRSPSERNALVSAWSEGQLCALRSPDSDGLPFEEQCELFDLLASGLDGHNLARISAAYLPSPAARLWADSLYRCVSADAKSAFLRAWAPCIEPMSACVEAAETGEDATVSTASLFAATALAGLASHTRQVDEALQLLAPHPRDVGRLQSVIGAAGPMHVSVSAGLRGDAATVTWNPEPLCRLIDASACGTSPHAKASVFELSAPMLGKMAAGSHSASGLTMLRQGSDAALVRALTRLVCSDTTGILGSLEAHHRGGYGLVAFVSEMLRRGRTDELRVMTEQLRRGHDASEDPIAYLAHHDAWGQYRRAATLGYYVGAVQVACQEDRLDQKLLADTLMAVLVGGLADGPEGQDKFWLSGGAARALQRLSASSPSGPDAFIADRLMQSLKADCASDVMTALVLPHPAESSPFAKMGAEIAYATALRRVFDAHRVVSAMHPNPPPETPP